MRLSREELQVAMERAESYPPGVPAEHWAHSVPCSVANKASELAKLIVERPEFAGCGCPAVAVAVHRGQIDGRGIVAASRHIHQALGVDDWRFFNLLSRDPKAAAALFRAELEREAEK